MTPLATWAERTAGVSVTLRHRPGGCPLPQSDRRTRYAGRPRRACDDVSPCASGHGGRRRWRHPSRERFL